MIHRQAETEMGVAAWALEISTHTPSDILPTPTRPHFLILLTLSTSCSIRLPSIQIQKPIEAVLFQTTSLGHIFFLYWREKPQAFTTYTHASRKLPPVWELTF